MVRGRGQGALALTAPTAAQLTDPAAKKAVMSLAQRGLSARGINNRVQALNAWLRWLYGEGHVPSLIKIPLLKVEKLLPPALTEADMRKLLAYRPNGTNELRAWTLAVLILDCGLRLDEARFLRIEDINLDSCVLKVFGKGRKERLVPFSPTARKFLWLYGKSRYAPALGSLAGRSGLLFISRTGTPVSKRNAQRDVAALGEKAGLSMRLHPHLLRHTFATFYIRNGGDVCRLQRILGHTTLEMTMRYVQLQTADLSEAHPHLSPVSRASR
jgi:site-specific recombinase XerD